MQRYPAVGPDVTQAGGPTSSRHTEAIVTALSVPPPHGPRIRLASSNSSSFLAQKLNSNFQTNYLNSFILKN